MAEQCSVHVRSRVFGLPESCAKKGDAPSLRCLQIGADAVGRHKIDLKNRCWFGEWKPLAPHPADHALIQRRECHDPAHQDACRSRGWNRARYERLRPEREEVRGASPYDTIENEPAPKLIVDPPLPGSQRGHLQAQYRVENVRILPVFGRRPQRISRLGHLHITVDDLPWLWADAMKQQYSRHSRATARRAQGEDRVGRR